MKKPKKRKPSRLQIHEQKLASIAVAIASLRGDLRELMEITRVNKNEINTLSNIVKAPAPEKGSPWKVESDGVLWVRVG